MVNTLSSGNEAILQRLKFSFVLVSLILFLGALLIGQVPLAHAAGAEDNLAKINTDIQVALTTARSGDIESARTAYKKYDNAWFDVEDSVKTQSKEAYRAIEQKMSDVNIAFSKTSPETSQIVTTLEALDREQQAFIKGLPAGSSSTAGSTTGGSSTTVPPATSAASGPGATRAAVPTAAVNPSSSATTTTTTIDSVLGLLETARTAQAKGDYAAAAASVSKFQNDWLDVEGQVKTRSAEDYRQTENDMALAFNLLSQKSSEGKAVLDRMITRLEPYKQASRYGVFDATIILLREGLEALLVVVALLTFLKKSGNSEKQPWIWSGVGAGLALSIVLGIIIQVVFSSAINASNREVIEGITGLVAAVMLIYISYWMHSKSSAVSWNRYIKQKSTAALAKGSLFGLAFLSFLAIFREGAESVLFFLGMGSGISLSDLLIGLAIGTVALVIIGFFLVVAGLKIPIGPFFLIASILVFYLCFKFVGVGLHALQVGKIIPATPSSYLPENGFFGLYPTWETAIPQLLLLLGAIFVVVNGRIRDKRETPQSAFIGPSPVVK